MGSRRDLVIGLAVSSAEHRNLLEDRLGRLLDERQGIEGRLRALDQAPVKTPNPAGWVDAILAGKRIPAPSSLGAQGIGDSFKVAAGARCEVQQTDRAREIEVIPLRFAREGTGLVLVGVGAEASRAAWG